MIRPKLWRYTEVQVNSGSGRFYHNMAPSIKEKRIIWSYTVDKNLLETSRWLKPLTCCAAARLGVRRDDARVAEAPEVQAVPVVVVLGDRGDGERDCRDRSLWLSIWDVRCTQGLLCNITACAVIAEALEDRHKHASGHWLSLHTDICLHPQILVSKLVLCLKYRWEAYVTPKNESSALLWRIFILPSFYLLSTISPLSKYILAVVLHLFPPQLKGLLLPCVTKTVARGIHR